MRSIQPDSTQSRLNRLHYLAGEFYALQFRISCILYLDPLKHVLFCPVHVMLMTFAILFEIRSSYCVFFKPILVIFLTYLKSPSIQLNCIVSTIPSKSQEEEELPYQIFPFYNVQWAPKINQSCLFFDVSKILMYTFPMTNYQELLQ